MRQGPEPGVASARSDECNSGIDDDCIQTHSDTTVRLVTLPEEWTVVLNWLRQNVYCHVKSGIACFQMPENPELLNDLKFENGSSSGSVDLSPKRRSDCERNVSNPPEHNKLKISRDNHPQRSSHYVENQVMVKSPSCWIDPFQAKLDKRRTTKLTSTAEAMSREVIELKQAALWHGGKIRIDQARKAAAEGMMRQPKVPRISFRSEEINSSSVKHQECATSSQTLPPPIMRIIVVRSGIASNEWWNVSRTEFNGYPVFFLYPTLLDVKTALSGTHTAFSVSSLPQPCHVAQL